MCVGCVEAGTIESLGNRPTSRMGVCRVCRVQNKKQRDQKQEWKEYRINSTKTDRPWGSGRQEEERMALYRTPLCARMQVDVPISRFPQLDQEYGGPGVNTSLQVGECNQEGGASEIGVLSCSSSVFNADAHSRSLAPVGLFSWSRASITGWLGSVRREAQFTQRQTPSKRSDTTRAPGVKQRARLVPYLQQKKKPR